MIRVTQSSHQYGESVSFRIVTESNVILISFAILIFIIFQLHNQIINIDTDLLCLFFFILHNQVIKRKGIESIQCGGYLNTIKRKGKRNQSHTYKEVFEGIESYWGLIFHPSSIVLFQHSHLNITKLDRIPT